MGVRTDYLGRDTFTWWVGEVEEIRDPAELGRIKVRILGWHDTKSCYHQVKLNQLGPGW